MDTLATTAPANSLADFCAAFVSRNKENWPPTEGTLAQEFAHRFSLRLLSSAERILEFARGLGIDASLKALPDGMHGFNGSIEGQTVLILSEQEHVPGSREHTLFHELREIMEYHFRDLGWPTAQGSELERRAEQFAALVRMAGWTNELGPLFKNAQGVEEAWKRWLAFAGAFILALAVGLGCGLLPYFEENLPKSKYK